MSHTKNALFKRKALVWSLLMIFPILTGLAYMSLRTVNGPFWLTENLDPSYDYLANSVNMANLRRPYNMEPHPGVTVQWTGAITLRILNGTANERELATRVFSDPERYLNWTNGVLVTFYCFCLILAGFIIYRVTGSLFLSLLIQGSAYYSSHMLEGLLGFRPEALFLSFTLLFAVLTILVTRFDIERHALQFSIGFGVLYGLGMASKINFMGLVFVPLILLPRWKWRFVFAAISGAVFLVAITPILTTSHLQRMSAFVFNSLTHTGRYGAGSAGFVDTSKLAGVSTSLIVNDWLFFTIVGISVVALLFRSRISLSDRSSKVLLAVVVAEVAQFAIVAKHPHSRYLIPSLGMVGVNMFVLANIVVEASHRMGMRQRRVLLSAFAIAIVAVQSILFIKLYERLDASRVYQLEASQVLKSRFNGYPVITYYTSTAQDYALKHGAEWSGNLYGALLDELYPNSRFYNPWTREFSSFNRSLKLTEIVPGDQPFVMHGCSLIDKDFAVFLPPDSFPSDLDMEPVFRGNTDEPGVFDGETIYMVRKRNSQQ